ncbi:MAG: GAF domain-containing protein, partial [Cyanobacteria bacterium J06632_19]
KENNKLLLEQMLEFENQIQQAISELSNQEAILKDVCQKIQSPFSFDLALIALVNPEKNIVETVYERASTANTSIKCKYYLEKKPYLRNIRADIVKTRHTEIISGWDSRFDKWIYQEYNQKEYIRIFTPILLYWDKNGNIVEDWFEKCEWKVITEEITDDGYRTVLEIQENQLTEGSFQVIGTVNLGYENLTEQITPEQAIVSVKLLAQEALKIRHTQLSYVLEVIAENARRILKADVAAIDFIYEPEDKRYIYQVLNGKVTENLWETFTSRKKELGKEALQEAKPIFVTNSQQNCLNNLAKLLGKKNKAMVAFPLQVEDKEGFLHLEFHDERQFTEDEIFLLHLFASRANSAILHATAKADKKAQEAQIANLHLFSQSLIHETEKEVLQQRIIWEIGNIIGADIVILNEYSQPHGKFLKPLKIVGRLIQERDKYPELDRNDKSLMLIKNGSNIYESSLDSSEMFKDSDLIKQEGIKSTAAILLKVGEQVVGGMFILYRRIYNFSKDEQDLIETLASSAAYAIKNQRWLQSSFDALSDIERELITTLEEDKLLNKIVERAVEKIKADFGSIRLLLPNNRELETKAFYPSNTPRQVLQRTNIEQGITGWVAKNRQPAIVNDIQQDPRFLGDVENVRSELCLPLLDKKEHLIGVLNVESHQVNAFEPKDLRLLQQIAHLAVIAIQNAKKQELLAKSEAMVTLGDIAGPLVHRTNNNVGAIRVLAQDICDEADEDEDIKSLATEIVSIAEQVLEYSQKMRSWMKDQFQIINLEKDIIKNILTKINIPENIQTNINIDSDLYQVHAGKQQLINVFENLIQNAITAMSNGGELFIEGSNLKTDAREWIKICVC